MTASERSSTQNWAIGLTLALSCLGACSLSKEPATQLIIDVDGDPRVSSALTRVRAFVYPSDASDEGKPSHQQLFALAHDQPKAGEVKLPFSFGIEQGSATSVIVVVKGYTGSIANAKPVIEQKLVAAFEPGKAVALKVALTEACLNRANQCEGLSLTCVAMRRGASQPGSCIDIHPSMDAGARTESDASAADGGEDANVSIQEPPPAKCTVENNCKDTYPCVPSSSFGYSCQGQMAEWPMPDAIPGAKFAPSYDVASVSGETIDKVTGLFWQRTLPDGYKSCTGAINKASDTCTWAEARRYCEAFTLGGHRWRLPTKIELESLIDLTVNKVDTAMINAEAFPDTPRLDFWTSSPEAFDDKQAWFVAFGDGTASYADQTDAKAVRCVHSVLMRAGSPDDRYELSDGGNTVTDTRTRLSWNLSVYSEDRSWDAAKAACAGLDGGYRLPTIKELLTIVDPLVYNQAVDSTFKLPGYTLEHQIWSGYRDPVSNGVMVMGAALGSTLPDVIIRDVNSRTTTPINFTYHALCVR